MLTSVLRAKAGAAGGIAALAAAAGLIVAAVAVPAVGGAGILARDTANKFNNLAVPALGQLPVRSEILDQYGHPLAYFYPSGFGSKHNPIDRIPVSYGRSRRSCGRRSSRSRTRGTTSTVRWTSRAPSAR